MGKALSGKLSCTRTGLVQVISSVVASHHRDACIHVYALELCLYMDKKLPAYDYG